MSNLYTLSVSEPKRIKADKPWKCQECGNPGRGRGMSYTAYDYNRQAWVTGKAAKPLLVAQAKETLAILLSGAAANYLEFTGATLTVAEARAAIHAQLAQLED